MASSALSITGAQLRVSSGPARGRPASRGALESCRLRRPQMWSSTLIARPAVCPHSRYAANREGVARARVAGRGGEATRPHTVLPLAGGDTNSPQPVARHALAAGAPLRRAVSCAASPPSLPRRAALLAPGLAMLLQPQRRSSAAELASEGIFGERFQQCPATFTVPDDWKSRPGQRAKMEKYVLYTGARSQLHLFALCSHQACTSASPAHFNHFYIKQTPRSLLRHR